MKRTFSRSGVDMSSVDQYQWKSVRMGARWLLLTFIVCAIGCSTRPKGDRTTLAPSPVDLLVEYHAGTTLSGPVNKTVQIPDDTTQETFELRVMLLDHFASADGQPLSIHSRLITSRGTSTAVLPATSLTRSVRWVRGDPLTQDAVDSPDKNAHVTRQSQPVVREVLLMNEVTMQATLQLASPSPDTKSSGPLQRQVMFAMRRVNALPQSVSDAASLNPSPGQSLRLALAITDDAESYRRARRSQRVEEQQSQAEDGTQQGVRSSNASDRITETIVVDLPLYEGQIRGSIILPFEMSGTPWRSIMITVRNSSQPVSPELVANVNASLTHWQQVVASRPSFASKQFASDHTELTSAFELLESNTQRRSAMIFLAGRTGASMMGDLALVSDNLLLELFIQHIKTAVESTPIAQSQSLGWVLDLACMKVLVEQSGQRITRETQGVMSSYLGEVARRSAMLQELVEESKTRDAFDTRLQAENLISLEDDSPSARVRAFNWLSKRAMAPQGYDPLGNAQSRRAALEKVGGSATESAPNASGASGVSNTTDDAIPMLPSLAPMEKEPLPATGSEGTR